jgi:hypothetical protein
MTLTHKHIDARSPVAIALMRPMLPASASPGLVGRCVMRTERLLRDNQFNAASVAEGSNPVDEVVKPASRMQTTVRSLPAAPRGDTRVALAAWPSKLYADGVALRCSAPSSGATMSIGSGKTIVEFLSAAITVNVSR